MPVWGLAGPEGAAWRKFAQIRRQARDGVKGFPFFLKRRNGTHQGAGVSVPGSGKKRSCGSGFDNAAGIHNIHHIADLMDYREVVGDENNGNAKALLLVFDQVEDLLLDRDVQSRGGFIGNEELGLGDEGHGDHDALPHAAGEFVRILVHPAGGVRDAYFFQGGDAFLPSGFFVQSLMQAQRLYQLGAYPEKWIKRGHGVLEDHADAAAADFLEFFL